jgi:septation ring formation regulator EzrA
VEVCRLKEDHQAKLKHLQDLNKQLLAELSAKQQDNSQFEALQDQLERATSRLEMESSGRAELWQRCTALEQELQTAQDNLEVATRSLKRAEQQLGGCCTAHVQ